MAMKKLGPDKKKGMEADTARKTKQAQTMGMEKIKSARSSAGYTKRKTAEAISVMGKKKAPSSYALGLLDSQKKKKAMEAKTGMPSWATAAQLKPVTKPAAKPVAKKKSRP
jgi:hypothetical protein